MIYAIISIIIAIILGILLYVNMQKNTDLKAENAVLRSKLEELPKEQERIKAESAANFEIIASKLLQQTAANFNATGKNEILNILKPFSEDLESLYKTIDNKFTNETAQMASLKQMVETLTKLNSALDSDAKELSNALRNNGKVQGDWGEMILEKLLETSGLHEGVNYVRQSMKDEHGVLLKDENMRGLRPDVIFKLPGNKCIIIDSKVSLKDFVGFVNSDGEEQKVFLKQHVSSVKRHVDELAKVNYSKYIEGSAEFVMLFIPNEGAYSAAYQSDPSLWEYATSRHIMIVSPTHLMAVLKLMHQIWAQENQANNTKEIVKMVTDLYDKFCGFADDLKKVGTQIDNAKASYESALSKRITGKGNLVRRVEQISQKAEITSTKILPPHDE